MAVALCLAYATAYALQAMLRHDTLGTNAFDLGYEDQVLWNTLHGRPFEFSLLRGASFSLDYQAAPGSDDHVVLGYHAELLLAPLSLLYAIAPDVRVLLALQAVVVCAGGVAAYGLASRRLGSGWAGLFATLAYVGSPFVEAELLSDFHAVALASALLMLLFYLVERRLAFPALLVGAVAALVKEDAPVVVAMLGAWALLVRRWRVPGLALLGLGAGVAAFDLLWLIPHFSPLQASPFLRRYLYLGSHRAGVRENLARLPAALASTLLSPETLSYARALVGSTAGLPLLAPLTLAVAAPSLAINALASFPWQRSGMAHYSALVLPVLIASSVDGVRHAARWRTASRRGRFGGSGSDGRRGADGPRADPVVLPAPGSRMRVGGATSRRLVVALAAIVAAASLGTHVVLGAGPGGRGFGPQPPDAHARMLNRFLAEIPPGDPVSVSSALYPHVSHREGVYLFPTVLDAREVLLDLTTTPFPQQWSGQRLGLLTLLQQGSFGVVDAEDGYVLLRRGAPASNLPARALSFTEGPPALASAPPLATFDGTLALLRASTEPSVTIGSRWQQTLSLDFLASEPLGEDVTLAVWAGSEPRPVPPDFDGDVPTLVWLPTSNWQPGRVVHVDVPPVWVARPGGMQIGWYRSDGQGHVAGWLRCADASGRACPLDSHYVVRADPARMPGLSRWLSGVGALWDEARSVAGIASR